MSKDTTIDADIDSVSKYSPVSGPVRPRVPPTRTAAVRRIVGILDSMDADERVRAVGAIVALYGAQS